MRSRFGWLALVIAASVLPAAGAAAEEGPRHVVDGSAADWREDVATMVPGTAAYAHHEWAFTDYVYDDRGAGGAFTYPAGHGNNAADIAVLQIAADSDAVATWSG